tara:strand:- start:104 stop:352 length:249 start_codon:yes stop_codon:yes gene_type:complete
MKYTDSAFREFLSRGISDDDLPLKTSVYDLFGTDLTTFKQQETLREIETLCELIEGHRSSIDRLEKIIATLEKDLDIKSKVY